MQRKGFLFIFSLLFAVSCSHSKTQTDFENEGCFRIPLTYFSFSEAAIAKIEIERKQFSLLLDTGANYYFALQKPCLDKIEKKNPLEPIKGIDIKGNTYVEDAYQLPLIKIANIKIEDVPVKEKSLAFILSRGLSSNITDREQQQIEHLHGNVGNQFLNHFVCFYDLSNSVLLLSPNLENITKSHCLAEFTETSFESSSNGFVILELETDFGTKKMLLDSGTSHSILRKSQIPPKSTTLANNNLYSTISRKLNINGSDFGAWEFFLYEFTNKFPEPFDGILGIDFFKDHIICIDYVNKKAFIKSHHRPFKKFWAKTLRIAQFPTS